VGRPVFWVLVGLSLLIALGLGALISGSWQTVQLFAHRVPFAQTDPTFGLNIGFYIFELPFYRLVQSYANTLLLVSIALISIRYLVAVISGASMPTAARTHVGILIMLYLFSIAIGFQLDRYELVYSGQSGVFQGVSYADANAKFLAFNVMTILAAFAGTLFLLFCFTKWWIPLTVDGGGVDRRLRGARLRLPADRPASGGRAQPAGPGDALHSEQHRHDTARFQPDRLVDRFIYTGLDAHSGFAGCRAADDPEPAPVGLPTPRANAQQHAIDPQLLQLR